MYDFFYLKKKKEKRIPQEFCLSKLLEACKAAAGWPRKEEEGDDEAVQVKSHLTLPKDTVRDRSKDDPKNCPLTGTVIKLVSVLEE